MGLYASYVDLNTTTQKQVYGNGGVYEVQFVQLTMDPEWETTTMNWAILPWGCRKLLQWISNRYGNPPLYITEDGCALEDTLENGEVKDTLRKEFIENYLAASHKAIENEVNLKGYFVWSFMGNFIK